MENKEANPFREILSSCHLGKNEDGNLRGHIDGTITGYSDMPNNPTPEEVVVFRRKPDYMARCRQQTINILGLEGGRPYVNARLSRYSGESEIDWVGGDRPDGSTSTGRLQQTHSFPYLGRIAGKVNQHVFQTPPKREGANEDVLSDITRDGKSINDLMRMVSSYTFAAGWCWIGVDAPPMKEDGTGYTVAEKEAMKIRPYWQFYSPLDVLDWYFDEKGELEWIKTQRIEYDDRDPSAQPTPKRVISLWEKGKVTEYTIREKQDRRYATGRRIQTDVEEIPLTKNNGQPLDVVPFVLCGETGMAPIPFDDLESINRTIMDLGSVDRANYFNAVYPQLVLPASVMQRSLQDGYGKSVTEVAKLILGFKYPITLEKDDPEPKYLMPDAAAIGTIAERVNGLKHDLFEVVGMALEQSSRQVASAEAKAWDFLDVAAVMASRAQLLEEIETKVVQVSMAWDDSFEGWEPEYNRDFDIGDFKSEIEAIVMAGNMNVPPEVSKEVVKKLVDRLDRIGSPLTDEEKAEVYESIEAWNPDAFIETLAIPEP